MIDLHVHTCFSDGEHTPKEVIDIAKENELEMISITDHDSVNGVDEAILEGEKNGIYVIPGIEITAFEDEEIHILGYNIDVNSKIIKEYVNRVKRNREEELLVISNYLSSIGIDVSREDVDRYRDGEIITIWHFAMVIHEKGYTDSVEEAIFKYFRSTPLNNITKDRVDVKTAIKIIKEAGGTAVLAHPARLRFSKEELDDKIGNWIKYGLAGIEAVYSLNSDEENDYYLKLAQKLNLIQTIGSDYHGEHVKPNIKMGMGVNNSMVKYNIYTTNDIKFS